MSDLAQLFSFDQYDSSLPQDDEDIFPAFEFEQFEHMDELASKPAPSAFGLEAPALEISKSCEIPPFMSNLDDDMGLFDPPSPSHSVASSLCTAPLMQRLGSSSSTASSSSPYSPGSPAHPLSPFVGEDIPSSVAFEHDDLEFARVQEQAQQQPAQLPMGLGLGLGLGMAHQVKEEPAESEHEPMDQEDEDEEQEEEEQEASVSEPSAANLRVVSLALPSAMAVRVSPAPETLWYARRTHPAFEVELVDQESGEVVPNATGLAVEVKLVDANGNDVTSTISQNNACPTLAHGCTTITGLRYSMVTSKCGGHFRLEVSVVGAPGCTIADFVSDEIQVLSYRLYRSPKVAFDKLTPDAPVKHMKGIGAMYAKRLEALGVKSVEQLAAMNVETLGRDRCKKMISTLRKDRGALTLERLKHYIAQAQDVVTRFYEDN